jgi:hypothetical protein
MTVYKVVIVSKRQCFLIDVDSGKVVDLEWTTELETKYSRFIEKKKEKDK